ncbi:hypothetical protein ACFX2C_009699 [Malus domestica]
MTDKSNSQMRLPATLPPPPVKQESIPDSLSALVITNRFTPLGSTVGNFKPNYHQPRPNYQTALVNSYDPYSSQSASYAKTSPYVLKNPKEYLFSIPFNINQEQAPEKIAKTVFPPNLHYQPIESYKTFKFYQAILMET